MKNGVIGDQLNWKSRENQLSKVDLLVKQQDLKRIGKKMYVDHS